MASSKGCFNDIRLFAACYGMLLLTDIMAGVMKSSSLTSIERRFSLPSTTTALLASSFQIGSLTTVLFASYFGSRWHRPRAIFVGSAVMFLSNLIVTLPQFVGGRYEYEDVAANATSKTTQISECEADVWVRESSTIEDAQFNQDFCEEEGKPSNKLYLLMVIGMMLNGVGGSVLQPLGMSYIDDFSHKRNSPLYLGITHAVALVGPMAGYVVSAVVLRLWVDIGWTDLSTITITPTHPSWVGAWWLGLLICNSGIAVTMMPFPYFPKKMKPQIYKSKTAESDKDDEIDNEEIDEIAETKSDDSYSSKDNKMGEKKRIVQTLKSMASNHLFHLIVLKMYLSNAALVGVVNFFPKYLEVGFGVSASKASLLTGVINIPCLVVGTLVGAITMKKFNVSSLGMTKMIAAGTFSATLCMSAMLFIGCETIDIAGITTPYADGNEDVLPSVESTCNTNCGCSSGTYAPICGSDGVSYVSPCHAGCTEVEYGEGGMKQNFTDCRCIVSDDISISWAKPERCELSKCGDLVNVALALKSLGSLFGGIASTPMYIFMLRSVEPEQKPLAIGLYLVIVRVLAWVPGPILYGVAIDSACLYWGKKPCSDKAYCKVYDNTIYRHRFYGMIVICNIFSCIVAIALYITVRRNPTPENTEELAPMNATAEGSEEDTDKDVEEKLISNKDHIYKDEAV